MILDKLTYDNFVKSSHNLVGEEITVKNNIKIDYMELKAILNEYNDFQNRFHTYSPEFCLIINCIEMAIATSDFTEKQLERLLLWFNGMSEIEISQKLNVSNVSVHQSLTSAFKKISERLKEVIECVYGNS